MSVPQRVFLHWSRPAVVSVAERLLAWNARQPDLFRRSLVLAPTRESCRRLREELGRLAGCVLAPRILPAGQLLAPPEGEETPPILELAAWYETLSALKERLPALLPRAQRWSDELFLDVAARVQEIMRDLTVGGLLPEEVHARLDGRDERGWRELAACFRAWSVLMREIGVTSSPEWARREMALPSRLAGCRGKIIVACVPGVPAPVRRALEGASAPVEVWVHAPEETAHLFDDWGQPNEGWLDQRIDLDEEAIISAETAADLAEVACRALAASSESGCGLGMCDPALAAPLDHALEQRGAGLYNPEGETLAASGWAPLLRDIAAYAEAPEFAASLFKIARSTIAACGLGWVDHEGFCRELSSLEQSFFPETTASARSLLAETASRRAAERAGVPGATPDARELGMQKRFLASWDALAAWARRAAESGDDLLACLALWARRCSDSPQAAEDEAWKASAEHMLADIEALRSYPGLSVPVVAGLLGLRLAQTRRPQTRLNSSEIDAPGWMEMLYAREPHLVLAGFSDGMVPEAPRDTPLLGEKLRGELGLEHAAGKAARDSYLLRDLVESRRASGSVRLLFARFSATGDPQAPSPLLFRCRDEELPGRVMRLFGRPGFRAPRAPRELGLWGVEQQLSGYVAATPETKVAELLPGFCNPWEGGEKGFSPSRLNLFWACPMRFWLAEAWRLRGNEPLLDKATLDAREVGNVMHEALRLFAARFPDLGSIEGLGEEALCAEMDAFLDAALGGAAEHRFMPAAMQKRNMRRRLHAFASQHVAGLKEGWECVLVEHAVGTGGEAWAWQGYPMEFRLDRLDVWRDASGTVRRVRVIDYKTGNPADYMQGAQPSPAKKCLRKIGEGELARWFPGLSPVLAGKGARQAAHRWADLQMPVYAAWATEWAHRRYGLAPQDVEPWYAFLPADPWATCMIPWKNFASAPEGESVGPSPAESGRLWAAAAMECIVRGTGFVSAERLGWEAPPYDRLAEIFGYAPDFSPDAQQGGHEP